MKLQVPGFRFAGGHAGLKRGGAFDLGLIACEGPDGAPARVAATFTASRAAAAPVIVSRERAAGGLCRGLVVNSGNANACTGPKGMADAKAMTAAAARVIGASGEEGLVASTGVIGAPLPVDRIRRALPGLADGLGADRFTDLARAILTTDTAEKIAAAEARIGGRRVRVVGAAKGAGMIMPDMTLAARPGRGRHATMLAFLCTDARASLQALRRATRGAVDATFNAITVDGDTSTNDSVFVLASGHASGPEIHGGAEAAALERLLRRIMGELAQAIVADGEGATCVVEVRVEGAASVAEADRVARRVANSPLVKTAIHGRDPNWGRIVAAAATAGVPVDPDRMDLSIGKVALYRRGRWRGADAEKAAHAVMREPAYPIRLHLHRGEAARSVWTCDLSAEYVRINADYRS